MDTNKYYFRADISRVGRFGGQTFVILAADSAEAIHLALKKMNMDDAPPNLVVKVERVTNE